MYFNCDYLAMMKRHVVSGTFDLLNELDKILNFITNYLKMCIPFCMYEDDRRNRSNDALQ